MADVKVNTGYRPRIATVTGWTILFFVVLRVAIGWHFFYEGVWKIKSGTFSSTPYLLASVGPLKDVFHAMVDDADGFKRIGIVAEHRGDQRVVTKISPDYQLAELDKRYKLVISHYELNDEQQKVFSQMRDRKKAQIEANAADPELLAQANTYVMLLDQVAAEEKSVDPHFLQERMEFNITKVNGARNALLARVEQPVKDLQPIGAGEIDRRARFTPEQLAEVRKNELGVELTEAQFERGPLPLPQAAEFPGKQLNQWFGMPFKTTTRTKWQDLGMMFGLVAIGACLILGLFTRLAAFGAVVFLAMFYLSMPPWPGVAEVPPLEGHYLIVNKNLIELIACLMIMTSGVGRWMGLDAFLGAMKDRRRRNRTEAVYATAQAPSDRVYLPGEGRPAARETANV